MDNVGNFIQKSTRWTLFFGLTLIAAAWTTSFYDYFTVTKWLALYGTAFLLLFQLLIRPDLFTIPSLGRGYYLIATVAGLYCLSVVLNLHGNYQNQILDWSAFSVLACVSYAAFSNTNIALKYLVASNLIATAFVVGIGLCQYFHLELFPQLRQNDFPASVFGFQNMTAEFVALSVLINISASFSNSDLQQKNKFRIPLLIMCIVSVYYLYLLSCRAVWVALVFSLVPFFKLQSVFPYKKIIAIFLAIATVALIPQIVPTLSKNISPLSSHLQEAKKSNAQIRIIRWMNTLKMIKEHPFGIGPGNYEFGYLPYHRSFQYDYESSEESLVRSPHNGYLEAAAESGILFALVLSAAIALFFRYLWKIQVSKERSAVKALVLSIFLFIAIDALFAFPLENAFPFYIGAVFLGLALRICFPTPVSLSNIQKKILVGLLSILIGFSGAAFGFSKFVEAGFPDDYKKMSLACNYFPSNWRVCLRKAELEIDQHKLEEAKLTLQAILRSSPNNYLAIRNLSIAYLVEGNQKQACKYMKLYDKLFFGTWKDSELHGDLIRNCSFSEEQ